MELPEDSEEVSVMSHSADFAWAP